MKIGDRVKLLNMPDDPDPIEPGSMGTIDWLGEFGPKQQVGVAWDSGRSLMLIRGVDSFVVVYDEDSG